MKSISIQVTKNIFTSMTARHREGGGKNLYWVDETGVAQGRRAVYEMVFGIQNLYVGEARSLEEYLRRKASENPHRKGLASDQLGEQTDALV